MTIPNFEHEAERIAREGCCLNSNKSCPCMKEIAQALRAAYLKGLQAHPCCCESTEDCDHEDQGFDKGFEAAREKSAKVAIDYKSSGKFEVGHGFMTDLDEVAIQIRQLRPEGGEAGK